MKETSTGEAEAAEPTADEAAPVPAYEPPAIAWEEAFEAMAATSCALDSPLNGPCFARPTV